MVSGRAWVGLNDIDEENVFVWTDGSPKSYAKFYSNQPNNAGGNEDCVVMFKNFGGVYGDYPCSNTNTFICETNYESLYM